MKMCLFANALFFLLSLNPKVCDPVSDLFFFSSIHSLPFPKKPYFSPLKIPYIYFSSCLVSKLISDGCVPLGCEEDVLFTLLWNEFSQSQKVFSVNIHFQGRAMYLLLVLSQQKMSVAVLYVYSPKCSVMVTCPSLLALGWGMRIRPAHLLRPTATVIGTVCIRHANTNETPEPLRKQSPGKLTFCLFFLLNKKNHEHFQRLNIFPRSSLNIVPRFCHLHLNYCKTKKKAISCQYRWSVSAERTTHSIRFEGKGFNPQN